MGEINNRRADVEKRLALFRGRLIVAPMPMQCAVTKLERANHFVAPTSETFFRLSICGADCRARVTNRGYLDCLISRGIIIVVMRVQKSFWPR